MEDVFSLVTKISEEFVLEKEIDSNLVFSKNKYLWVFNDRLNAPSSEDSFDKIKPSFSFT